MKKQFAKPEGWQGRIATYLMNICNQALYRSVLNNIPKHKNISVLDIGYGNGFLLKKIIKNGYKKVCGLEISDTMHAVVKHELKSYIRSEQCELQLGGIESMPFMDHRFDVVYSVNTIYFWESMDKGLQEIKRVLKQDGQFMLAFYDERFLRILPYTRIGFQLYKNESVEQAIIRNGLKVKKQILKKFGTAICFVCEIEKE